MRQRLRLKIVIILAAALLTAASAAMSGAQREKEQPVGAFDDLLSDDPLVLDRAVDRILADRKALIEGLIPLIDPDNAEKHSDETRSAAAYLLGELRAEEAVPVLAKAMTNPPGRKLFTEISRYDGAVFNALVKIGRPAVPAMIEVVRTADPGSISKLRASSMLVLSHVLGGKGRLLGLLDRLRERALAQDPPDHESEYRFRAARDYAREKFTEDEEPLY